MRIARHLTGLAFTLLIATALGAGEASPVSAGPAWPPSTQMSNWKSGISLRLEGKAGVDYCFERWYHDPKVDDHGTVYIRSETRILFEHNERNRHSTNYKLQEQRVGKNGPDQKPNSGDEGVIRIKPDMDWNWALSWSNGFRGSVIPEGRKCPAYKGPFRFADTTYFDGTRVLGSTGPSLPLPYPKLESRKRGGWRNPEFYWRGFKDKAGDEWHVLQVGDDEFGVGKLFYEQYCSDGKIYYFVVNPKTPIIGWQSSGRLAQFYTTPPKAYFVPKLLTQTTYIMPGVSLFFTNLTDPAQPVLYKIDGVCDWQTFAKPIALDTLGLEKTKAYTLRCKVGQTGPERLRTLVYCPAFPSQEEPHPSPVLFKDEATLARIRKQIRENKQFKAGYASFAKPIADKSRRKHTGTKFGYHDAGRLAFPCAIDSIKTFPNHAWNAKVSVLDNILLTDPIGFERSHNISTPGRSRVHHGYYIANKALAVALGYDLLIGTYRWPEYEDGFTPIEDLKARDTLANFVATAMQMHPGFPDPVESKPGIGMWDTARKMVGMIIAMMMPEYDTPYYGTSGSRGKQATHKWTPYPNLAISWFEMFNARKYGQGIYGLISDTDKPTTWADRPGYFGYHMMGGIFARMCVARAQFDGHHYPHIEEAFSLALKSQLKVKKRNGNDAPVIHNGWPIATSTVLFVNELFPTLAPQAQVDFEQGVAAKKERYGLGWCFYANGPWSLSYTRLDWKKHVK